MLSLAQGTQEAQGAQSSPGLMDGSLDRWIDLLLENRRKSMPQGMLFYYSIQLFPGKEILDLLKENLLFLPGFVG